MNYFAIPGVRKLGMTDENIFVQVSRHVGVRIEDIKGRSRRADIVRARMTAMYIFRIKMKYPLKVIASYFKKDHTTVIHACQTIEKFLSINDEKTVTDIEVILDKFK